MFNTTEATWRVLLIRDCTKLQRLQSQSELSTQILGLFKLCFLCDMHACNYNFVYWLTPNKFISRTRTGQKAGCKKWMFYRHKLFARLSELESWQSNWKADQLWFSRLQTCMSVVWGHSNKCPSYLLYWKKCNDPN